MQTQNEQPESVPVHAVVTTRVENATAGKWYQSQKYGRVLCCGTSDADRWVMAFAIRDEDGRTVMKYFHNMSLTQSETQSW